MKPRLVVFALLALFALILTAGSAFAEDAGSIVQSALDYIRGKNSRSTVKMTIHRPDWTREVTIKAWTQGSKDSIFFITKPPKDQGNGTLKKGVQMWMYNPKVNRTIKIPPSMMSQSWQGSDFSNNDLAKSDSITKDYNHTITGTKTVDGKKVYEIKSMPKPQAPVVWGMQTWLIREDFIPLRQEFFDQDLKSVKVLTCSKIKTMGGKLYPTVWKMQESDDKGKYTLIDYVELEFNIKLRPNLFSLSSLSNPMSLR